MIYIENNRLKRTNDEWLEIIKEAIMTITHDYDCRYCDEPTFGAMILLDDCPHCGKKDRLVRNIPKKPIK
jgi:hypothetical protein